MRYGPDEPALLGIVVREYLADVVDRAAWHACLSKFLQPETGWLAREGNAQLRNKFRAVREAVRVAPEPRVSGYLG